MERLVSDICPNVNKKSCKKLTYRINLNFNVVLRLQNSNSFMADLNCAAGLEDNLSKF